MFSYVSILAAISLPLVALLYYYLTKNYRYWEKKGVPYVKGALPGFGNVSSLIFMRKNKIQMWEELYNKMPGCSMVGFYFARDPALLIRDPELVKAVLQTDFTNFSANGTIIELDADPLFSSNPALVEGEKWKTARQQLSSAFSSGKLRSMYSLIETIRKNFVTYLYEQTNRGDNDQTADIELKATFSRFTAEVLASAAFGLEGDSFKNEEGFFSYIGKRLTAPTYENGVKLLMVMFVPGMATLFDQGYFGPEIDRSFRKIITDMLKYRSENNVERNDFLQAMMKLKNEAALDRSSGGNVNNNTILSHSASLFFDLYETLSITITFFAYQLARHPEVQQRVREEIHAAVEQHDGLTYDALQGMKYMEQALNESLRLHHTDGAMFKVCTGETVLKGSDGVVCKVEPGTPVMISMQGLHMDPEYWPDPHKFDPERFSDENKHRIRKYAFLPFGEGPRICIGMRMGILLTKAVIATMLINFSLKLSPKTQLPIKLNPRYSLASAIGGLWVELKPL